MSYDNLGTLKNIQNSAYNRLNKNKSDFVDCFTEEFEFIRKSDEYMFNIQMNNLNATNLVLDDAHDLTDKVLLKDITNPIKHKTGMTIGHTGASGTGKSRNSIKIAMISKKFNEEYMNRKTSGKFGFHLCWNENQFKDALKILKKGDIILKDETTIHIGKGRLTQKWSINNILNTIRKKENTFLFVDPYDINMPCNLYLESAGMDTKHRINRVMLMQVDRITKKRYYFGHAYIKLHDNKELEKWYENEKDKFIDDNIDKGGEQPVINKDVIDVKFKDVDEELEIKLNFGNEKYINLFKIKENKERDIMIWKLYNMDFKDKEISSISGIHVTTVRQIYNKLEDAFKKELKPKIDLLI